MIKESMLYEKCNDKEVHCYLCAHHCRIKNSGFGICRVRKNIDGELKTLVYAEAIAANIDPIEKKPLFHFLCGSTSYSIATIGCNFKCGFCQNWQISQKTKESKESEESSGVKLEPKDIIREAKLNNCLSISYTYTEPTIFFEYAYDSAKLAKAEGIKNVFVTNGYMSREALKAISPYLDAANIDLKSLNEEFYQKKCKAHLNPVLDSIKLAKELGIWIEITTLIIPGENDSDGELKDIANFIAAIDKNIPWHISRFHPDYKFLDKKATPIEVLKKAKTIGKTAGLRYIYIGNVLADANTYCPKCKEVLIKRDCFEVSKNNIEKDECSNCSEKIAGVFS